MPNQPIPTPIPTDLWVRPCRIVNVVDGDTVDVDVDLGYGVVLQSAKHRPIRVRLLGVQCPEMNTPAGKAAREFTLWWPERYRTSPWPCLIRTEKDPTDSFGRYLAVIWARDDGSCLNDLLVVSGHAVEYRK